jgi:hypothetical protein
MLSRFKIRNLVLARYFEVNIKFMFKAILVFMEYSLKQRLKIQLVVSGGLAAQLNAVAYLIWARENLNRKVNLLFIEKGTVVRYWEINHISDVNLKIIHARRTNFLARVTRLILRPFTLRTGLISKVDLLNLPFYKIIIEGYHLDISVLEESIPTLRYLISQTNHLNFLENPASEETLAIHWRLGDYIDTGIGNIRHGYIETDTIVNEIKKLCSMKEPSSISIFTDSKDIASTKLKQEETNFSYSVYSSDIWRDLFEMSKSKYFIASHSGISIWVILAIKSYDKESLISVPRNWFKEVSKDFLDGKQNLQLPQYHFNDLFVYHNELH